MNTVKVQKVASWYGRWIGEFETTRSHLLGNKPPFWPLLLVALYVVGALFIMVTCFDYRCWIIFIQAIGERRFTHMILVWREAETKAKLARMEEREKELEEELRKHRR